MKAPWGCAGSMALRMDAREAARTLRQGKPERWRWWDPLDRLTLLVLRLEAGNVILGEKRRRRAERNSNVKSTNNAYDLRGTPRQGATERPREGSTRSRPGWAHAPQDGPRPSDDGLGERMRTMPDGRTGREAP